jgi:demethoxyubiquinone hydroxylase (CLK1/Coq7/Cat5 family)
VLNEILQEERSHENHLHVFLGDLRPHRTKEFFLKISGYLLGFLLALVPRPLYFYFHAWAEEQASEIYRQTKVKLGDFDLKLTQTLDEAVVQEANHAKRFREMI